MKEGEESDNSLTSTDITLKESLHADISLHILECLKESDFLMIGEREGEFTDRFTHKVSIERDSFYMTDTGFLDDFFPLECLILELKEFFVGEFVFCELIGIECFRSMKGLDVFYPRAMFSLCPYLFWKYFGYIFEVLEEERYFLSKPFGVNSLYLSIDGEIRLSLFTEELYIWLREGEFSIFVLWFSMDDNGVTWFDWLFEKRCMKKDTLRGHAIFISHEELCEFFLKTCLFLQYIDERDFDGIFLLDIHIGKRIEDISSVLYITRKKEE